MWSSVLSLLVIVIVIRWAVLQIIRPRKANATSDGWTDANGSNWSFFSGGGDGGCDSGSDGGSCGGDGGGGSD